MEMILHITLLGTVKSGMIELRQLILQIIKLVGLHRELNILRILIGFILILLFFELIEDQMVPTEMGLNIYSSKPMMRIRQQENGIAMQLILIFLILILVL